MKKTGERLSQTQISNIQQDVLVTQAEVGNLSDKFKALSKKINDKVNHLGQVIKSSSIPKHPAYETDSANTSYVTQSNETPISLLSTARQTQETDELSSQP